MYHQTPEDSENQTQDATAPASVSPKSHGSQPSTNSSSTHGPHAPRFAPGSLIGDRYRVVAFLGRGGMGEVYRADDLELAQSVAIKLLPSRIAQDPTLADRVRKEVRLARQITHRNVCRIHDIARLPTTDVGTGDLDSPGGDLFISMEYVDGEDLSTLLRRIGRLPQDKAIDVARQLCAALAAAHDQGVIHRDLKPANIMLDGRGNVRLTDFGIAAIIDEVGQHDATSGTPAYMAPEQYSGEGVSQRSDIYALGLVIYELLTGKPAWKADSLAELQTLRGSKTTPPALTTTGRADIDPALAALVDRCLETDPNNRPSMALAVAAALPGADPIAAALAAGETPSPELIAASGGHGVLTPKIAATIVAVNVLLITLAALFTQGASLLTIIEPPPAPALMREAALNLVSELGYSVEDTRGVMQPVRDGWTTSNFSIGKTQAAIRDGTLDDWSGLAHCFSSPIRYWLRIEPNGFLTTNPSAVVSQVDPPRTTPGSMYIQIDASRRLKGFRRKAEARTSHSTVTEPNWSQVFSLAGLNIENFEPIANRNQGGTDADVRRGWKGFYPADDSGLEPAAIQVYAASFNGKVCEFDIAADELIDDVANASEIDQTDSEIDIGSERDATDEPPQAERSPAPQQTAQFVQAAARWVILTTITLVAALLAYRNIRRKRSDLQRAIRLGATVFVLTTFTGLLSADTFSSGLTLLFGPFPIYSLGLGFCFITVICYIAIEPLARAKWPNSLVSWTRLFSGSFRDPMIGRDILIGTTAGCTIIALTALAQFLAPRLSSYLGPDAYAPDTSSIIPILRGSKAIVAQISTQIAVSFLNSAAIAVLILLTMVVFGWCRIHRRWPALLTVAFLSMLQSVTASNFSVADRAVLIFGNVLIVVLLDRVGLLATAVAIASSSILTFFIAAAPYDQWWAPAGIIPGATVAALLLFAYRTSTAGRSLFTETT